jgi:hypothetical protein
MSVTHSVVKLTICKKLFPFLTIFSISLHVSAYMTIIKCLYYFEVETIVLRLGLIQLSCSPIYALVYSIVMRHCPCVLHMCCCDSN